MVDCAAGFNVMVNGWLAPVAAEIRMRPFRHAPDRRRCEVADQSWRLFGEAASQVAAGMDPAHAAVSGDVLSYRIGAVVLAVGAVMCVVLLEKIRSDVEVPAH